MNPTGWLPPTLRNKQQRRLTAMFHEAIQTFETLNPYLSTLPERALAYDLEVKATGKLLPRINQITGSCVGCGGARAYTIAQCGDVVIRGDREAIKVPFPFATYGVGRQIAGMDGRGEGSFGGAQAEAVESFGMLPWDDSRLPKPTQKGNWLRWTKAVELQWSHPSGWPIKRSELEPESSRYKIENVTRVTTFEGLLQALAQGYGVTVASMFGCDNPRVEKDVLMAKWDTEWAHQMCYSGFWKHPELGYIVSEDNQWGDAHGECPTLGPMGVDGSFWKSQKTAEKVLKSKDTEVYAHSNTGGFPLREIDWGTVGII